MEAKWIFVIIVIVFLGILSFIIAGIVSLFFSSEISLGSNTALIPIKGAITSDGQIGWFTQELSSTDVIELIEKADKDVNIKAILFEINSPGGTAVASEEIVNAVKKTKKFKVAWIRDQGTSGAYWVASATDKIVASPLSITGSIGVLASYLEFSGLLERYNITYQKNVGGKYKNIGTPYKDLTSEEKELFQKSVDELHEYFKEDVMKNRNIPFNKINTISTGMFYTGQQAKEIGLIDVLGGKEEALDLIEKEIKAKPSIVEYKQKRGFLESLYGVFSDSFFRLGQGIGSVFKEELVIRT